MSRYPKSGKAAAFVKNVFLVHAEIPRGPLDASVVRLSRGLGGCPARLVPGAAPASESCTTSTGSWSPAIPRLEGRWKRPLPQHSPDPAGPVPGVLGHRPTRLADALFRQEARGRLHREEQTQGSTVFGTLALLVAGSGPTPSDVFLDPFAGSGAIVRARLRWPARKVIYNDIQLAAHRADVRGLATQGCVALDEDALVLPSVASGSVDAIVTDPPWGEYGDGFRDYSKFASDMAASLTRVLDRAHGRAVLLVNRRNTAVVEEAFSRAGLRLDAPVEILVNGHPATVVRGAAVH